MKTTKFAFLLICLASTALAGGPEERKFIHEGMSAGEVLMKIGKPDAESTDSGGGAKVAVQRWVYFPAPGDRQTLTTIVIKNGQVAEVIREISR